jgi:DNA-binding CsgD family transcriptional regulator
MKHLTEQEQIIDKLDKILRVLSMQVGADKSVTERAFLLKVAGLDNKIIAEILNTDAATIRTLISRSKKLLG